MIKLKNWEDLEILDLEKNQLTALPTITLGKLKNLKKLNVRDNRLSKIPETIQVTSMLTVDFYV